MALRTMLSKEKDNKQIQLRFDYYKGDRLVYHIEDTRSDDLKNVYFINQQKAFDVYDEKEKELA
jgi:hypothetical protein